MIITLCIKVGDTNSKVSDRQNEVSDIHRRNEASDDLDQGSATRGPRGRFMWPAV